MTVDIINVKIEIDIIPNMHPVDDPTRIVSWNISRSRSASDWLNSIAGYDVVAREICELGARAGISLSANPIGQPWVRSPRDYGYLRLCTGRCITCSTPCHDVMSRYAECCVPRANFIFIILIVVHIVFIFFFSLSWNINCRSRIVVFVLNYLSYILILHLLI